MRLFKFYVKIDFKNYEKPKTLPDNSAKFKSLKRQTPLIVDPTKENILFIGLRNGERPDDVKSLTQDGKSKAYYLDSYYKQQSRNLDIDSFVRDDCTFICDLKECFAVTPDLEVPQECTFDRIYIDHYTLYFVDASLIKGVLQQIGRWLKKGGELYYPTICFSKDSYRWEFSKDYYYYPSRKKTVVICRLGRSTAIRTRSNGQCYACLDNTPGNETDMYYGLSAVSQVILENTKYTFNGKRVFSSGHSGESAYSVVQYDGVTGPPYPLKRGKRHIERAILPYFKITRPYV